jgi:hypothetical protein
MSESKLTRRTALSALAAGTGTLAFAPQCLAASSRKLPTVSFIVVSDTHLGHHDQDHAARQWAETAAEIAKSEAELVLHLGDVVDGGREAQYPVYLKTKKSIGKPVHEIPGNHDPEPLFEKHIRQAVSTAVDHKWLRFLLINNSRTDSHDGFVSDEQIEWIDRRCAEAARLDRFVILCMHVPAHKNLHPDRGWYVKPGEGQMDLYQTIERHRDRVLALFHGHFHNGLRGWSDHGSLHEICFPSALYNRDRKLEAQQAPGYNLDEFRAGYTVVTMKDGIMRLEYKPLGAEAKAAKALKALPAVEKRPG